MRKFTFVPLLALVAVLLFAGQQSSSAATYVASVNSLTVTGFTAIDAQICGDTIYQPPNGTPFTNAVANLTMVSGFVGQPHTFIVADIYDALGNQIGHSTPSLWNVIVPTDNLVIGVQMAQTPSVRPWRLVLKEDTGAEIASLIFDPADIDSRCGILPYQGVILAVDQSVTPEVSIFGGTDENGFESLTIYGINDEGEGHFLFEITQNMLAPYADNPPEQNTELASADNVTLYMLTTSEYQLNIGPDDEGKVRVIIFEGLPPTNVYSYDFNVYDVLGE